MRYLSLCSGIEAASVAWLPLGWTPVAYAEHDPECITDAGFAAALLQERFPETRNLGDITKIRTRDVRALGPIDLVVGGTPCQDLSVAGAREGIQGARSSLFFDFVRIFDAARRFCGARWALWENVPGTFVSNQGRDFASVVGTLAGCDLAPPADGWGWEGVAVGDYGLVEWAVLDSQWFGLAQRRDRLFALLDTGNWADRPPLLLEPESVRGDSAPRREAGARVTGTFTARTRDRASSGVGARNVICEDVADPVSTREGRTYTREGSENFRMRNVVACFDETQITHPENRSTALPDAAAMAASARPPTIALSLRGREEGNVPEVEKEDVAPFLRTGGGGSGNPMVLPGDSMAVRRLTPTECERLFGFPDGWTAIQYRGKPAKDTPRYAALGNSMAVNVLRWIGRRLQEVSP